MALSEDSILAKNFKAFYEKILPYLNGAQSEPMVGATSTEDGVCGLAPQPKAGDQEKFLKGDGTWGGVTIPDVPDMVGATASANGSHGLVKQPLIADRASFLKGDGTWQKLCVNYVPTTLASGSWISGQYSFESTYPSATYDLEVFINRSSATAAEIEAFNLAQVGGYYISNIIIAAGTVPTIDIHVVLKVSTKFPENPSLS